jgi:hypothetical protein
MTNIEGNLSLHRSRLQPQAENLAANQGGHANDTPLWSARKGRPRRAPPAWLGPKTTDLRRSSAAKPMQRGADRIAKCTGQRRADNLKINR